jgi:hypothetical protein
VAPVSGKMVVEFRIKAEVGAGWRRLHIIMLALQLS